jgi:hypothetical protein
MTTSPNSLEYFGLDQDPTYAPLCKEGTGTGLCKPLQPGTDIGSYSSIGSGHLHRLWQWHRLRLLHRVWQWHMLSTGNRLINGIGSAVV